MKDGMQTTSGGSPCEPVIRPVGEERELANETQKDLRRSMATVADVVSITRQAWCPDPVYAPAVVRDRFLASLDARDWDTSTEMALNLTECGNPLPGMTCSEFGLPIGSTYGAAARCVLATDALERSKRC
jgi:hypothetical protein